VFQIHAVNEHGKTVMKRQLKRDQVTEEVGEPAVGQGLGKSMNNFPLLAGTMLDRNAGNERG
jgi:hypothetical protein